MKRQTDRPTDRETHGLSRGVGLQRLRLSCFRAVVRGFGRASLCPWGLWGRTLGSRPVLDTGNLVSTRSRVHVFASSFLLLPWAPWAYCHLSLPV